VDKLPRHILADIFAMVYHSNVKEINYRTDEDIELYGEEFGTRDCEKNKYMFTLVQIYTQ
jgi:hypothetical protein